MVYAYEFACRDFILRTTRKIVGPPDSLSWWSCGPLLKKVCVKPCITLTYINLKADYLFLEIYIGAIGILI